MKLAFSTFKIMLALRFRASYFQFKLSASNSLFMSNFESIIEIIGCPSSPPRARRQGFTLIGLLVVIVIIGALLLPVLARAKERGQQAACKSNMRQATLAAIMYADDNMDGSPKCHGIRRRTRPIARLTRCRWPTSSKKGLPLISGDACRMASVDREIYFTRVL